MNDSRKTKAQLIEELQTLWDRVRELEQPTASISRESPLVDLKDFVATAPIGLCLLDTDLRFVYINDWLAAINGRPVEEHLGRKISEVLPDVSAEVESQLQHVIETGEPILAGNVEAETPAHPDETRHFQHNYQVVKSKDGTVIGVGCVVEDITDRKRAEEELRQRELELAHASRLNTLGEMVAGVVHEISQPLFAATNFTAACQHELANVSTQESRKLSNWIGDIGQSIGQAGTIVNRLRQFAMRRALVRERLKIDKIVAESLHFVAFDIRRENVDLAVEADPDLLELRVCVDRVQLQQVLVNLVRNACEALRETSATDRCITIRLSRVNDTLEIAVEDHGVGISDDDSSKLFDAFFTTKETGLGMGLAISRTIVEEHGGRIWWTPNADRGATFHFTLPLAVEEIRA